MRTALVALTLVALTGAPAYSQKVKVKYDRDYSFGEVRTYAWGELTRPDASPLFDAQIIASLEKWLEQAHVRKVAPSESPDILLSYHTNPESSFQIDFTQLTPGELALIIQPDGVFARGTLVLEAHDAREGKLVFHGVARGTLEEKPTEANEKIDKAAFKLAKELGDSISRYEPDLHPFDGRPVKGIDLLGFKKTKEYVIRREIRTAVGEPLDLSAVDDDVVRLDNLNIFAQIRVDAREEEDGVQLEYQFKETPSFIPYPAFSFTEENGFSYGGGLAAANLAGRDIAASGRALFGGTNNYNLLLEWPWISGNHVSFGFFGAHIERTDEVRGFNETSDEVLPWVGTYFAGDRGRLKAGPSYFRMQSDVDGVTIGADNVDELHRLGLAVGWDTRDSWTVPHHGWLNELQVFRTGGFLGGEGDFWTVDIDLRRFQPLGERRTLVLASLLTLQSGEAFVDLPSYMRYHLGGANTIRGYAVEDSKVLSGKNQYLGTIELRQTLAPPRRYDIGNWSFNFGLEVAALGDLGYAWDESDQFEFSSFRGGVGIGLRLLKPGSGMTRFDFAWSRDGGFQFHFGGGSKMARQRLRLR